MNPRPFVAQPSLRHLCDLKVSVGKPIETGEDATGRRRIIPITGGTVEGERVNGTILDLGADWQVILPNGNAELDTRYAFVTHDGVTIDIRNFGYRNGPPDVIAALARGEEVDPSLYYMRTQPRFFTADPRYEWLTRMLCIGSGIRRADQVIISLYEAL